MCTANEATSYANEFTFSLYHQHMYNIWRYSILAVKIDAVISMQHGKVHIDAYG